MIVRIGEVGGDSGFYPRLLLYGPDGTLLTSSYSGQAVEVAHRAAANGIYTVVVSTYDGALAGVGASGSTFGGGGGGVLPKMDSDTQTPR